MIENRDPQTRQPSIDDTLIPIRRRIDQLRSRIRRGFLVDGLLRLLAVILGVLLASFLLDYLLDLPVGVRGVLLVAGIALVAATAFLRVVRPLTVPLDDEELALVVEARRPELKDRMISALQFVRQIEDPENEESPELMRAVVAQTADLARSSSFVDTISARALAIPALILVGLMIATTVTGAVSSDLLGLWARRALLADEAWPRKTTLVVLDPETDRPLDAEEPLVIARGDDLSVVVEAQGDVPDEVWIHYRPLDGDGDGDQRRMGRLSDTAEGGRFEFTFRQAPRSFAFYVVGGDDDDELPVFEVRALVAPSVESIAARCVFPDYTGRSPETITTGDFEVPVGTVIDMVIRTNMPVRSATISLDSGEPRPMEFHSSGKHGIRLVVEQSVEYAIALVGPENQRNRDGQDAYRITAVPDRRPEVRLLSPTSRDLFSPTALLPLKILATDNYGVDSLEIAWRLGLTGEPQRRPVPGSAGGKKVVAFEPLEVASLGQTDGRVAQSGDLLLFRVTARDNNGLEDQTDDEVRLEIAAPAEVERRLGQRQVSLREEAASARTIQADARRTLDVLLSDIGPGEALDRAAVNRLRDAQILQGRVTRKMTEFTSGIERVLNGYTFNRLGNPIAGQAILEIYLRHLAADREDLSRVYKRKLYDDIVAAFRRGEIFDPEVLGILIQIIEVSSDIRDRLSPRAHGLVSSLVRGESGDPAKALREIAEVQGACIAEFEKLMKMMKRWETYHEFILRMRDLEDAQQSITDRARQTQQNERPR